MICVRGLPIFGMLDSNDSLAVLSLPTLWFEVSRHKLICMAILVLARPIYVASQPFGPCQKSNNNSLDLETRLWWLEDTALWLGSSTFMVEYWHKGHSNQRRCECDWKLEFLSSASEWSSEPELRLMTLLLEYWPWRAFGTIFGDNNHNCSIFRLPSFEYHWCCHKRCFQSQGRWTWTKKESNRSHWHRNALLENTDGRVQVAAAVICSMTTCIWCR